MSLQHVTATCHKCSCNKSWWQTTPLFFGKLDHSNFAAKGMIAFFWSCFFPIVFTTSHRKSNQLEFGRLVVVTKFCYSDKDFHKNSPVHGKRFVTATCCSNLLPSVYWQLSDRSTSQTISSFFPQSLPLLGISVVNLKLQKYHISVLSFSHPFIKIRSFYKCLDNTLWRMCMLEAIILKKSP